MRLMNILVVGKFYAEGFALHIAETLADMGNNVRQLEIGHTSKFWPSLYGRRVVKVLNTLHTLSDNQPSIRAWRIRGLWQAIEQAPLDVVIVCHDFLLPYEVEELKRKSGALIAMWFPDAIVNFNRAMFMNAPYDAIFFKDPFIVHRLNDILRSPVYYLPECFNPKRHILPTESKLDQATYSCDITTAGNLHSWRVAFFKHLTDYNVKIWGNQPPLWLPAGSVLDMFQDRGVYNEEKALAFRSSRIVLNNLHYGEIFGVNVRCFEAAGVGAFQMVDWRPALEHLFLDGRELVTFTNMADLKAKINYWLPREAERRAIAEAGRYRAHSEHTYRHRLELLLATVCGTAKGFSAPVIGYQVGYGH
jgi:spore maturation protein CgeB